MTDRSEKADFRLAGVPTGTRDSVLTTAYANRKKASQGRKALVEKMRERLQRSAGQ